MDIYTLLILRTKQVTNENLLYSMGFPYSSVGKDPPALQESVCSAGFHLQCRRPKFDSSVGKIPWRRKWQPTPVFLPEKSHGQRSLAVHGGQKSQTRLRD